MTKEEYIKTRAAILARCCSTRTPREECKRIKQICGCSMREAEKIFTETIDEAEKIRERNNPPKLKRYVFYIFNNMGCSINLRAAHERTF